MKQVEIVSPLKKAGKTHGRASDPEPRPKNSPQRPFAFSRSMVQALMDVPEDARAETLLEAVLALSGAGHDAPENPVVQAAAEDELSRAAEGCLRAFSRECGRPFKATERSLAPIRLLLARGADASDIERVGALLARKWGADAGLSAMLSPARAFDPDLFDDRLAEARAEGAGEDFRDFHWGGGMS